MVTGGPLADSFTTFGSFLRYVRKRARLTQRDLGLAVGYSVPQISLLENDQRLPNITTLAALFIPALQLQDDPRLTTRLLELAAASRAKVEAATLAAPGSNALREPLRSNLPAPLLPLIGRTGELDQLQTLLLDRAARLISLIGPPGVGKTRLALQLGRDVQDQFGDGAHWIDLSFIAEPGLVAAALRAALQLPAPIDRAVNELDVLRDGLHDREALLVIDNFEQVIAAAPIIADVLVAAPRVKAIVTSRAALELYGEHTFTLAPLPLPDLDHLPPLKELQQFSSMALFIERARAVHPAWTLTPQNAPAVAAICVRLDGLPLALELVAAQSHIFTPHDLLLRLDAHQPLTAHGMRHRPARHRTLAAAIAWSYRQLSSNEQRLFCALSVFAGGFTVPAIEALTSIVDPIGTFSLLLAKSLVQPQPEADGELRFVLLETIREFAAEQLGNSDAQAVVRQEQAAYFTALAERIEPQLAGVDQARWLNQLERERDNFRAALTWTLRDERDPARVEPALRLCVALWKYWRYRCYFTEGYTWTTRALQAARRDPQSHLILRAQAEWGAGLLAAVQRDEALATAHLKRSLRLWERAEDAGGIAGAMTALGARAMYRGDLDQAVEHQREALKLYAGEGDLQGMAYAHNALGESLRAAGDYSSSREHYQASLEVARQTGHRRSMAVAMANLAQLENAAGHVDAARKHLRQALTWFREIGDAVNVATGVMSLACSFAVADTAWSTGLFGLADRLLRESGGTFEQADRLEAERFQALARSRLGREPFDTAWQDGQTPSFEQRLWQMLSLDPS